MNKKVLKDLNRRKLFKKNEVKCLSFKIGIRLKKKLKINNIIKLNNLTQNNSITQLKNKCTITGRSKAVYSKMRISRIKFREILLNGHLVGFKKSCW